MWLYIYNIIYFIKKKLHTSSLEERITFIYIFIMILFQQEEKGDQAV